MAQVFISFIHEQEDKAKAVNVFLKELFPSVEIFQSSDMSIIYAGMDWMAKIFAELKEAKVLISMMSPESVSRPWINFEAGAAWMREAKVIPACFNGMTLGNLPKPYSSLQGIEIEKREYAHYLATSIAHHLGLPAPEKPYFGPKHLQPLALSDPVKQKDLVGPYNRLLFALTSTLQD